MLPLSLPCLVFVMSDQATAMDLSSPHNGKTASVTPIKQLPSASSPPSSRLSAGGSNSTSSAAAGGGNSPHMPMSAVLHRSPPSSSKHVTHRAGSITEVASPKLRLSIKQSPAHSPLHPNSSARPPQLDLSPPPSNRSPTQSPVEGTPVIPRLNSMPATSSSPSSSASSPSTNSVPPLSFRLKLSSLEVNSPHHDPIVLSSPPSSSHSASMPSPHTLFTARIPKLAMPADDEAGGGSDSVTSQRPHIPMLSLNVSASPTTTTRPFKHALNITTLNTSSDSPNTASSTSTASPILPTGNSSHDRAKRLAYYSKQATPITDFLYVGGKSIAADRQLLLSIGITHVVNLVGDLCDNYFPNDFVYQRWFLLDHAGEDIICILYPVMELIEWCRLNRGKVLIHCQQGVSRSCVLCIAYIMYSMSMDYDAAFQYVRQRRGICRPNVGFMAQLLAWHKRLTAVYHPLCLYRLAPHCSRDHTIVGKWVDRVDVSGLDERGVFVLHSNDCLYIWVGAAVGLGLLELYYPQALLLLDRLRKFEHAPQQHVVLYQRDERTAPEHKHGTAVPPHHVFHESTSSPSLSVNSSPSASSPSSPLHSPPTTRPLFPATFTESQKFWALLGGGSPLSQLHCAAYDEDYSQSMLADLPQRPASVPLPAMISARSVSSPATGGASVTAGAGGKTARAAVGETITEEDEKHAEGESQHVKLEKEVEAVASSTVSPPLSQRDSNDDEVIELRRRRSYHKSIDAAYLTSAHDHHYASIRPEEEVDDESMTDDTQSSDRTTAGSLTSRVDRLSMAHAGVEEAEDETAEGSDAAHHGSVPHASLYTYPAFENLDHFDSDDLNEDGVYVLLLLTPHTTQPPPPTSPHQPTNPPLSPPQMTLHIWLGTAVTLPTHQPNYEVWAEAIAIEFVGQFQPLRRSGEDNVKVVVERQNHESDEFWEAFVDG